MKKYTAAVEIKASAGLGEGPVWDDKIQQLYWIDIEDKKVYRYDPVSKQQSSWSLDQMVGCVSPVSDHELVVALQDQLALLDTNSGETTFLAPIEASLKDNRCNDGKADAAGRLWVGTLHLPGENQQAALYKVFSNLQKSNSKDASSLASSSSAARAGDQLTVSKEVDKMNMSNGLGWSPDNSMMYLIDTPNREVFQFKFSLKDGIITNRQLIFQFDESFGSPDGMCVDAEGMLWIAFYGGHCVRRFDPVSREQLAEVSVAAENVTCCCFGGSELDTLYITTAKGELPEAGCVFSVKPSVQGIKGNRFVL